MTPFISVAPAGLFSSAPSLRGLAPPATIRRPSGPDCHTDNSYHLSALRAWLPNRQHPPSDGPCGPDRPGRGAADAAGAQAGGFGRAPPGWEFTGQSHL